MINNYETINNLVNEIIEFLSEKEIHRIKVKSIQEVKNFILYHVGVETMVLLNSEKAIEVLQLEKSIIELGGTIIHSDIEVPNKELKSSIAKVKVYGNDYFIDNTYEKYFNHSNENLNGEEKVKIIFVLWMEHKDILKTLHKLKETLLKEGGNMNKYSSIKGRHKDISIIFIDGKQ